MKKALALLAAAALMAMAGTAMAKSITDSVHNLSVSGKTRNVTLSGSTQICIFCHTPHNGTGNLPLWNRNAPTQAANFQLYSGVGMANVSYKTFTSDSISLFCMSCHDGSPLGGTMIYNLPTTLPAAEKTALLNYAGQIGNSVQTNLQAFRTSGLKSTHPINFPVSQANNTQPGANGAGDLAAVTTVGTGKALASANNPGLNFPLYKSSRSLDSTFECSSCHSVHDDANTAFLRDTMAGSKLCLGCHLK